MIKKRLLCTVWLVLCSSVLTRSASGGYLEDALYYRDLTSYTCQVQIDYYQALSAYLEKTGAVHKPLLLSYYTGLAYFELGDFSRAEKLFNQAYSLPVPPPYDYYSRVMEAACLYRQGRKEAIDRLIGKKGGGKAFLGYILLRLDYQTGLAGALLAAQPEIRFGEAIDKWIAYKLDMLPVEELKIAGYRLKRKEFEENYAQLKLSKGAINISVKYFNPAQTGLLKEIFLEKARTDDPAAYLDYKRAIPPLRKYLKKFPLDMLANIRLAGFYYAAGNRGRAGKLWNWLEQSGGRFSHRELALALSSVPGKGNEALRVVKASQDKGISPGQRFDSGYYQRHKGYYQTLGRVYLNSKDYKKAATTLMLTYERSRSGKPRTYGREYLLSLGFALTKVGRYKEAIDNALKGASSLDPAVYPLFHAVNFGLYMLRHE
ncbi:MAG: hypothetical protein ACE5GM_03690 [bacterium]